MSPIVTVPDPVLRQPARPIEKVDKRLLDIISDMAATLVAARDPEGVGLAAPQIGLPLRLFLIRPDLKKPPQLFINPEILKYSQRQQTPDSKKGVFEGCLSIPHHYSPVRRSMSVTVRYQTIDPDPISTQSVESERAQRNRVRSEAEGTGSSSTRTSADEPVLMTKTETFSGFPAHIIQHEMDHLNGILFIDHALSQNAKLYLIKGDEWEEINV